MSARDSSYNTQRQKRDDKETKLAAVHCRQTFWTHLNLIANTEAESGMEKKVPIIMVPSVCDVATDAHLYTSFFLITFANQLI